MTTRCDHAIGNPRVLTTLAAELLGVAMRREIAQFDEKLYLEVLRAAEDCHGPSAALNGSPLMTIRFATDDSDPATHILDYLRDHLISYPFRHDLDVAFADELLVDFDDLDLLEQIKRLRWYHDDDPLDEHSKPRLAIRRWLVNARQRSR